MNIDDLTIGQVKQLQAMVSGGNTVQSGSHPMLGKKVIIRTYTAGVHYGTLAIKDGTEVILNNSRRLWYWQAKESISLSAVAVHGIDQKKSKIAPAVKEIWLDAIEIIPVTDEASKTLDGAPDAKTE